MPSKFSALPNASGCHAKQSAQSAILAGFLICASYLAAHSAERIGACSTSDERVVIAAVGDLLFQRPLQQQALASGGSYLRIWEAIAPVLKKAAIVYGNLEGTVAEGIGYNGLQVPDPGRRLDGLVYDAPPSRFSFNYHRSLIHDLKEGGFGVVSTANNHALDRYSRGIDRTIEALDAAKLAFTGTRKRGEIDRPWSVVTRARGFSVAWLACTYGTNGNADLHAQVLLCFEQQDILLSEIHNLNVSGVDAVIVVPHWGIEGHTVVEQRQRELAKAMFSAGALAIIGTHPHVLQEWEILKSEAREGLIVYSTGNFVSAQGGSAERTGIIVLLELSRDRGRGKARIARAGYVLTRVLRRPEFRVISATGTPTPREVPKDNRIHDVNRWLSPCP